MDNVEHVTSYILAVKFISSLVVSPRRETQRENMSSKKKPFLSFLILGLKQPFLTFIKKKKKKSVKFLH